MLDNRNRCSILPMLLCQFFPYLPSASCQCSTLMLGVIVLGRWSIGGVHVVAMGFPSPCCCVVVMLEDKDISYVWLWPFISHVLNSFNCTSLIPGPSQSYVWYMEAEEWQGRPASIHHMNDVRWLTGFKCSTCSLDSRCSRQLHSASV